MWEIDTSKATSICPLSASTFVHEQDRHPWRIRQPQIHIASSAPESSIALPGYPGHSISLRVLRPCWRHTCYRGCSNRDSCSCSLHTDLPSIPSETSCRVSYGG